MYIVLSDNSIRPKLEGKSKKTLDVIKLDQIQRQYVREPLHIKEAMVDKVKNDISDDADSQNNKTSRKSLQTLIVCRDKSEGEEGVNGN